MKIKHKFHAKQTICDGIKFPSKLEASYYNRLKLYEKSGELLFFLRQVPLHMTGGSKYVVDFVEFWTDGTVKFVDVKGMDTPMSKLKRVEIEALYPIEIEIYRKD